MFYHTACFAIPAWIFENYLAFSAYHKERAVGEFSNRFKLVPYSRAALTGFLDVSSLRCFYRFPPVIEDIMHLAVIDNIDIPLQLYYF
jgi:hypothetical protein